MTPGLPYGRGSYKGSDSYLDQQESFAIRRGLVPKNTGWVIRSTELFTYLDNLNPTAGRLSFARLAIYHETFELSQVRLRVVSNAANENCHTGLYVWVPSPVKSFRLISNSVKIWPTDAAGLYTHNFENPVKMIAGLQYFSGAFCTSAVPQLLSGFAGTDVDEATRTIADVTTLPKMAPLDGTTATYTNKVILPSYYSAQAAEIL